MEEIIDQDTAVVAFTASWCQPCKALKPQFAKASVMDNSDIDYYVVDVDQVDPIFLNTYGIQSIPQVFKMNKGIPSKKIVGKTASDILAEVRGI